jgi:hypothetical protein
VSAQAGFLDKLACAIGLLGNELPACCRTHVQEFGGKTEVAHQNSNGEVATLRGHDC